MVERQGEADVSLATLLAEVVATGTSLRPKSALWIGPAGMQGASMLADQGLQITAYLPKSSPRWRSRLRGKEQQEKKNGASLHKSPSQLRIRRFDSAPLFSKRKVELIVVPDMDVFGDEGERRLDELCALLDDNGVLAVGLWDPSRDAVLERIEKQLAKQVSHVSLWGQKRCSTSVWSTLEDPTLEAPTLEDGEEPPRDGSFEIVFDALQESSLPDRCLFVGFRDVSRGSLADVPNLLVAEPVDTTSQDQEFREVSDSDSTGAAKNAGAQANAQQEYANTQEEYVGELEERLRTLGRENRSLRGDLATRDVLVRDLVSRLEKARSVPQDTSDISSTHLLRSRDAAMERALEAEATCAELRFAMDELRLALSKAEASAKLSLSEQPLPEALDTSASTLSPNLPLEAEEMRSRLLGLRARAQDYESSSLLLQQQVARLGKDGEKLHKELERVREQSKEREERAEGWRSDLVRAHEEVVRLRNSERDAAAKLEEATQALEELSAQVQGRTDASPSVGGDESSREALGNLKRLLLQLTRNY